jgi:hypothetical protein
MNSLRVFGATDSPALSWGPMRAPRRSLGGRRRAQTAMEGAPYGARVPRAQASGAPSHRPACGGRASDDSTLGLRAPRLEQGAAIARAVGCTDCTVRKWRRRSRAGPTLQDAPRPGGPRFFPSAVRSQVTALACTLPRDSGKRLSRWSVTELVRAVVGRPARHRPAHLRRDHPVLAPGRPHQAVGYHSWQWCQRPMVEVW